MNLNVVIKEGCRHYVRAHLPSEARYFEAAWSATLGSLGLRDLSNVSPPIVQAVRDRLAAPLKDTSLRSKLSTTMEYAILVLIAASVEFRKGKDASELTASSVADAIETVISRTGIPKDIAQSLARNLTPFIVSIGSDQLETGRAAAETALPGISLNGLGSTSSSATKRGSSPNKRVKDTLGYLVEMKGEPPHVTVRVFSEETSWVTLTDPKDREFLYYLHDCVKTTGHLNFEMVCAIYGKKGLEATPARLAYVAHQRVDKLRRRLARRGLDPRRLFESERGRGFRPVFHVKGSSSISTHITVDPKSLENCRDLAYEGEEIPD